MYQSMMDAVREETVTYLYRVDLSKQRTRASQIQLEVPAQPKFLQYSAPSEGGGTETKVRQSEPVDTGTIDLNQEQTKKQKKKQKRKRGSLKS